MSEPVRALSHPSTRTARAVRLSALCWLAAAGCTKRAHDRTEAPPDSGEPRGATLVSPAAFDFSAAPNGARLAWAPANRAGGAVRLQSFGLDGSAEGTPRELVAETSVGGDISELSLIETPQRRLAIAYFERQKGRVELVAGEGDEHDLLKPSRLGPSTASAQGERGSLALSLDAREPVSVNLLARVAESECVDSGRRECTGFSWWRLARGSADSHGFSLSVPSPCHEHAVSLLGRPGKLAYAVCSQPGREQRTTLFTVQTDPQYARADEVLPGCHPLGLFADGSAAWLVADCGGRRRAARAGDDNGPVELRELASPRLECQAGRAELRAGPFDIALKTPTARLELLLPSVLAPPGSRAVWAGEALLVAATTSRKLSLSRYACQGNQLKEIGFSASVK